MEYLLKVSALVIIFYFAYKYLLERETFFMANRWYFLIGLVCSIILPLIVIKNYVEYVPEPIQSFAFTETTNQIPTEDIFNFWYYAQIIYLLGVAVFIVRFGINLASLLKLIFSHPKTTKGEFIMVETNTTTPPFSFFSWIVYNPDNFNKNELEQIINHEKIHSRQCHSLDILMSNICSIILWFNPFIWLYNKKLKQNLEFIADQGAANSSPCTKIYQYTLLKTCMPTHQLALGNTFYNSLIKKRIVMLHKSKSHKINLVKYLAIIPILAWFLMSFNAQTEYVQIEPSDQNSPTEISETQETPLVEIVSDEKPLVEPQKKTYQNEAKVVLSPNKTTSNILVKSSFTNDLIVAVINDNSSDADLDKIVSQFKDKGVAVKFKSIKRNSEGLITSIKIEAQSKESNSNFNLNSDKSISSISICYNTKSNNISIGNISSKDCKPAHNCSDKDCKHTCTNSSQAFIFSNDKVITTGSGKSYSVNKIKKGEHGIKVVSVGESNEDSEVAVVINNSKDKNHFVYSSNKNSKPLYIVDGEEVEEIKFNELSPEDIDRINVLKGAHAKEKYGDKAKDGVIEISTKK